MARAVGAEAKDQTIIVTGANCGIGFHTASSLARRGAHVILACRDPRRGRDAATRIMADVQTTGTVHPMVLDLGDFSSIDRFTQEFFEKYGQLNVLVNNAGLNNATAASDPLTAQGFERCMGVNYIGHYKLTQQLLPLLQKTADQGGNQSRVVNLSSVTHRIATIQTNLLGKSEHPGPYSASKLAMTLFTLHLQNHLKQEFPGVIAMSVNPGGVASDIWRASGMQRLMRMVLLTPEQGCQTSVFAALEPSLTGGEYITPYWVPMWCPSWLALLLDLHGPFLGPRVTRPAPMGLDRALARRLWDKTYALVSSVT